ncbi:MAG: ribosome maturation factor RimP [Nitrospirae bacterium]|nr:ribosome maturation factor RimP [Nitrospirota bacterium]MBF0542466.1 ribosome maturation factor RimP [Nitrospirota bacterium]
MNLELYEAVLMGRGSNRILKVTADKEEGGITIEDCANLSRQLGAVLDVEDFIRGHYTLEVSSPGLNRHLKSEADFIRSIGKNIRIVTKELIADGFVIIGKLAEVNELTIRVTPVDKEDILIDKLNISRARLELDI